MSDVKGRAFPAAEHVFSADDRVVESLESLYGQAKGQAQEQAKEKVESKS